MFCHFLFPMKFIDFGLVLLEKKVLQQVDYFVVVVGVVWMVVALLHFVMGHPR